MTSGALKSLEDVARELATDMCKLELVDFGRALRWKDTHEIVAHMFMERWVMMVQEDPERYA